MSNYSFERAGLETLYPFTATNPMTGNDLMNAAREFLPADDLRTRRLFEALDLLCKEGLISGDPDHLDTMFFITTKGMQQLQDEQDKEKQLKETHRHDYKVALFSAIVGFALGLLAPVLLRLFT